MKPTPEQIAEVQRHIKMMQNWCDGKQIQRLVGANQWMDVITPSWNWEVCDYRTKPEPRRFWIRNDKGALLMFPPLESHKHEWIETIEVLP